MTVGSLVSAGNTITDAANMMKKDNDKWTLHFFFPGHLIWPKKDLHGELFK